MSRSKEKPCAHVDQPLLCKLLQFPQRFFKKSNKIHITLSFQLNAQKYCKTFHLNDVSNLFKRYKQCLNDLSNLFEH